MVDAEEGQLPTVPEVYVQTDTPGIIEVSQRKTDKRSLVLSSW